MELIKDAEQRRRHLRAVERRQLARTRKLRDRRSSAGPSAPKFTDEVVVQAPGEFSLEGVYHDEVVKLLRSIRKAFKDGHPVCIDFRPTERMVAGATLLLFSELHRLKEMFPTRPLRCIAPKDKKVNEVLQHLKLFELLGYSNSVVPTSADVVSWRTASSAVVDGGKVGTVIEAYKSIDGIRAKHVFRGATEAMMNSMNHAYIDERQDGLPRPPSGKWWMFCRQDEDKLVIAVCDLGIGIPRSLPILYTEELIAKAVSSISRGKVRSDARMIEAAMEIQRTRTKRKGRGKGLSDIRRLVDEVHGSQLYLFSNRGLVKYIGGAYQRRNYATSIKGTVVLWIVPLKDEPND